MHGWQQRGVSSETRVCDSTPFRELRARCPQRARYADAAGSCCVTPCINPPPEAIASNRMGTICRSGNAVAMRSRARWSDLIWPNEGMITAPFGV